MTPPAAPLFPSLEIEAKSSQMVFQRELPIPPRQVKPSASRVDWMLILLDIYLLLISQRVLEYSLEKCAEYLSLDLFICDSS
jgi:hypothetical protein